MKADFDELQFVSKRNHSTNTHTLAVRTLCIARYITENMYCIFSTEILNSRIDRKWAWHEKNLHREKRKTNTEPLHCCTLEKRTKENVGLHN